MQHHCLHILERGIWSPSRTAPCPPSQPQPGHPLGFSPKQLGQCPSLGPPLLVPQPSEHACLLSLWLLALAPKLVWASGSQGIHFCMFRASPGPQPRDSDCVSPTSWGWVGVRGWSTEFCLHAPLWSLTLEKSHKQNDIITPHFTCLRSQGSSVSLSGPGYKVFSARAWLKRQSSARWRPQSQAARPFPEVIT